MIKSTALGCSGDLVPPAVCGPSPCQNESQWRTFNSPYENYIKLHHPMIFQMVTIARADLELPMYLVLVSWMSGLLQIIHLDTLPSSIFAGNPTRPQSQRARIRARKAEQQPGAPWTFHDFCRAKCFVDLPKLRSVCCRTTAREMASGKQIRGEKFLHHLSTQQEHRMVGYPTVFCQKH